MNKLTKVLFLNFAALLVFGLAGCGTTTTPNTTANAAKPADNKAATAPADNKAAAPKTETAAADAIGVPECDDFLKKYEACVMGKVPEAGRAAFKTGMDSWRTSWKQLAANPSTKATLADACKKTAETAKQSLASYSCDW